MSELKARVYRDHDISVLILAFFTWYCLSGIYVNRASNVASNNFTTKVAKKDKKQKKEHTVIAYRGDFPVL